MLLLMAKGKRVLTQRNDDSQKYEVPHYEITFLLQMLQMQYKASRLLRPDRESKSSE
jgi:hypothetical protein